MSEVLLISVRLHEGWYHGSDGLPSPARMFQALVAAAGLSGPLNKETITSLSWLENQAPPIVAAPHVTPQKPYVNYVPNNDLDSKQGDHRRIGEIRVKKLISPIIFDSEVPFLFAWKLTDEQAAESARRFLPLADRVYQLGRTVDMAWAWADILPEDELLGRLRSYAGIVRYPSAGSGNINCPTSGSLESLQRRYWAGADQFGRTFDGRGQTFRQRPKPKWKKVNYEGTSAQLLFELRRSDDAGFAPWPLERSCTLVEKIRDEAAGKLRHALESQTQEIDRTLIGRKPNGENAGPTSARVRIVPLPSIGHPQADMQIRRVLVEVPGDCPMRADDISWAFSGLQLTHPFLEKPIDITSTDDLDVLGFYGFGKPARTWRTVTPVALTDVPRRRMDPNRLIADEKEKKGGNEKYTEHQRAAYAVGQALRHADVNARIVSLRLQREPFDRRGARVDRFAEGTRFSQHCLWHLEVEFESPISGPLLLGDGRFLGLGLMRPIQPEGGVYAFSIESGLQHSPDPIELARALRRAVMSRARDVLSSSRLPSYFSGHPEDGSPGRSEKPHLAFTFDAIERQLLIVTPELLNRGKSWGDKKNRSTLEKIVEGLHELRAGENGLLQLQPENIDPARHHLFQGSRIWETCTPYDVNRHSRNTTAEIVLKHDVLNECERRGLPRPKVTVLKWKAVSKMGLRGWLRLEFKDAVPGPIILGRSRHLGGGLFAPQYEKS